MARAELVELANGRRGHFLLESGHHGDLWLDLDALFLHPRRVAPLAAELARRLAAHRIEAVCGPLVGGAFVAQLIAAALDVSFTYSVRRASPQTGVEYRIPGSLRDALRGKPVAVVDDVVNAGSATGATYDEIVACGARPVAVGALLVLGSGASLFAARHGVALECLESLPSGLWAPRECPLCASGVPLDDPTG